MSTAPDTDPKPLDFGSKCQLLADAREKVVPKPTVAAPADVHVVPVKDHAVGATHAISPLNDYGTLLSESGVVGHGLRRGRGVGSETTGFVLVVEFHDRGVVVEFEELDCLVHLAVERHLGEPPLVDVRLHPAGGVDDLGCGLGAIHENHTREGIHSRHNVSSFLQHALWTCCFV